MNDNGTNRYKALEELGYQLDGIDGNPRFSEIVLALRDAVLFFPEPPSPNDDPEGYVVARFLKLALAAIVKERLGCGLDKAAMEAARAEAQRREDLAQDALSQAQAATSATFEHRTALDILLSGRDLTPLKIGKTAHRDFIEGWDNPSGPPLIPVQ